jgi:hypothetical protein
MLRFETMFADGKVKWLPWSALNTTTALATYATRYECTSVLLGDDIDSVFATVDLTSVQADTWHNIIIQRQMGNAFDAYVPDLDVDIRVPRAQQDKRKTKLNYRLVRQRGLEPLAWRPLSPTSHHEMPFYCYNRLLSMHPKQADSSPQAAPLPDIAALFGDSPASPKITLPAIITQGSHF